MLVQEAGSAAGAPPTARIRAIACAVHASLTPAPVSDEAGRTACRAATARRWSPLPAGRLHLAARGALVHAPVRRGAHGALGARRDATLVASVEARGANASSTPEPQTRSLAFYLLGEERWMRGSTGEQMGEWAARSRAGAAPWRALAKPVGADSSMPPPTAGRTRGSGGSGSRHNWPCSGVPLAPGHPCAGRVVTAKPRVA